ncbi:MAG: hypothetical protein U9R19_01345, partial [Bacteroidota bacterium]|nr:hypothetical protein [Bacteroidota bacterium]
MKKTIIFFLCIFALQIVAFSNANSTISNNRTFQFGEIDYPGSDSIHYAYNDKEILIELGNYYQGKKFGKCYIFDENLKLLLSGNYNDKEIFTGFNFFHEKENLRIVYLQNNKTVQLNNDLQRKLTDSLLIDLQNLDFFGERVFSSKSSALSKLSGKLQSETDMQKRDSLSLRFLYELNSAKANLVFYNNEKARIKNLYNQFKGRRYSKGFEEIVFQYAMYPLLIEIENILTSENYMDVIGSYKTIVRSAAEVDQINSVFAPINNNVVYNFTTLVLDIETNMKQFEHIYNNLEPKYRNFRECDSLKLKIELGKELISYMTKAKDTISQYLSFGTQLNNKYSRLLAINTTEIQNFQNNYLTGIEKSKKRIQEGKTTGQELRAAKELIEKLDTIIFQINEIIENENKIKSDYSSLRADYEDKYERIYDFEVRKLAGFNEEIKETEYLSPRLQQSQIMLDSLAYFKNAYSQFQSADSLIATVFGYYKNLYHQYYINIYYKIITSIENQIKKYDREKRTNNKLNKIFQLEHDIDFIATSYSKLDSQSLLINEKFPLISKSFKDSFPSVYKESISEYADSINDYEKSKYINERLKLGKDAIAAIKLLEIAFENLSKQRRNMCMNYFETEGLYKRKYFKPIYKNEFKDVTSDMKKYAREGEIKPKQKSGESILSHTGFMIETFPELAKNDSLLRTRLSDNNKVYKKKYKKIFKAYIKLHNFNFKLYDEIGYVAIKLIDGKQLLDTVEHYYDYNIKLRQQKFDTEEAWDALQKSVKEKEKFVLRRGKKVYRGLYKKQYKKDINIISKVNTGNE